MFSESIMIFRESCLCMCVQTSNIIDISVLQTQTYWFYIIISNIFGKKFLFHGPCVYHVMGAAGINSTVFSDLICKWRNTFSFVLQCVILWET